jgi:hypothetical protein
MGATNGFKRGSLKTILKNFLTPQETLDKPFIAPKLETSHVTLQQKSLGSLYNFEAVF